MIARKYVFSDENDVRVMICVHSDTSRPEDSNTCLIVKTAVNLGSNIYLSADVLTVVWEIIQALVRSWPAH